MRVEDLDRNWAYREKTVASDMSPARDGVRFELTSFLAGKTRAWGIFEDRFGRLRRRFDVDMEGTWQDARFRLNERFRYDDGREEFRTWWVTPGISGAFRAECEDCVGGAQGQSGNDMVRMSYAFRLKLPSRSLVVDFDDRLYRISATRAVNRVTMRKWGVKLGELSLFFTREHGPDVEAGAGR